MKKPSFACAAICLLACAVTAWPLPARAQNCSSPPSAWGNTAAYESWCRGCGGTITGSGPRIRCNPGPNWGKQAGSAPAAGAVAGGITQPFYNLGYTFGQWLGSGLFGDPAEDARRQAQAAQTAEIVRRQAEAEAVQRRAAEAQARQESYDRLSSQIQLSGDFDGRGGGLPLMLGDGDTSAARPQGTSFFGVGGGQQGAGALVADARPRQGYTATTASPAVSGGGLPLMLGDPNVVDLSDRRSSAADSGTAKAAAQPAPVITASAASQAAASGDSNDLSFLFQGNRIFPKNPRKPLLNPLIELPKGESLPTRGETPDAFFARLQKTALGKKLTEEQTREDIRLLFPADSGRDYPRGRNPVVDMVVDESMARIAELERSRLREAAGKAVRDMNVEWAEMERKNIIRQGEDPAEKERSDAVYRNVLMAAHNRVYGRLEADIRSAKMASEQNVWILKQFCDHTQTAEFMGGPGRQAPGNPQQMKELLGKFMTFYSGDLR